MDSAKQQYDALVAIQSWDKETQIRYFLEYAEEYQLSAHFLSYLALKPSAENKLMTSSSHYSPENLIELLSRNSGISEAIKQHATEKEIDDEWTASLLIDCIRCHLAIEVDPNDDLLLKELLAYFNVKRAFLLRSMNKFSDMHSDVVSDKYRFGARG